MVLIEIQFMHDTMYHVSYLLYFGFLLGGGPSTQPKLTDTEEAVAALLDPHAVTGMADDIESEREHVVTGDFCILLN